MTTSIVERVQRINCLNLDPIKVKLMDSKEGKGWSRIQVDQVGKWYRRFLILNLKYSGEPIVPTKEVDDFWHQHILDTRKYADDCEYAFGYFFHHFPYFGMRGEEDAQCLTDSFKKSLLLFQKEFGAPITELNHIFLSDPTAGICRFCCGPTCKAGCKSSGETGYLERPILST